MYPEIEVGDKVRPQKTKNKGWVTSRKVGKQSKQLYARAEIHLIKNVGVPEDYKCRDSFGEEVHADKASKDVDARRNMKIKDQERETDAPVAESDETTAARLTKINKTAKAKHLAKKGQGDQLENNH
jgi:hypothetical protein